MSHPLIKDFSGATLNLPPMLLPSAAYYALIGSRQATCWEWGGRYDRSEKDTHRFEIADTRGRLMMTVPVAHPQPGMRWYEVELSDHGRWQETIPIALESAYGRTPFFEFYSDCILPVFGGAHGGDKLIDFVATLDRRVRDILGFTDQQVTFSRSHDVRPVSAELPSVAPYWQVRGENLGFIPGLSILDLIFNLGPEAPLYLRIS